MAAGLAGASAAPYTLTKYDDSSFAQFCYAQVVAPYDEHFDAAVTVGDWGICGFSDRTQRIGPGSVVHNSALYHRTNGEWAYSEKGNGYFTVTELELHGLSSGVAQGLLSKFRLSICLRSDVPRTSEYCANR
jgi:hypothetical protein